MAAVWHLASQPRRRFPATSGDGVRPGGNAWGVSLSPGQGYSFHGPELDEALALVELGEFSRRV